MKNTTTLSQGQPPREHTANDYTIDVTNEELFALTIIVARKEMSEAALGHCAMQLSLGTRMIEAVAQGGGNAVQVILLDRGSHHARRASCGAAPRGRLAW